MKKIGTVLALIVAFGCGGNEEEAKAAAEDLAAQLQAAADEAAEGAAEAAAEGAEAAAEANPAATGPANARNMGEGLQAMGAALGQAMQAAQAAEGGTPCEQAYNGAAAMMAALTKQLGEGNGQGMPDQEQFMNACNQLPENAQQCMIPAYAMQNQQECAALQNDPEVQRVRQLMRPSAGN